MNEDKVCLSRIQEILGGNENNILACMPIIKYSDRIGAIRDIFWEIESGKGIQWIDGQNEIKNMEEQTTELISKKEIEIYPAQLPILMGPLFFSEVENLSFDLKGNSKNIYDIQKGYKILIQDEDSYEPLKRELFVFSKNIFDKELKSSRKRFISSRAKSALGLLTGNPSTPQEDYYITTLAQKKIEDKSEEYKTYLRLASLDLEKQEKGIERLLTNYLDNL